MLHGTQAFTMGSLFQSYDKEKTYQVPNKNRLACWWCCHAFPHVPIGVPHTSNKHVSGIFCSWNCAIAYNMEKGGERVHDRHTAIRLLAKHVDDIALSRHVWAAPHRHVLKMFGGVLDIDEFRMCDTYEIRSSSNKIIDHLTPEHVEIMKTGRSHIPNKESKKKQKRGRTKQTLKPKNQKYHIVNNPCDIKTLKTKTLKNIGIF